jgi:hypothetical protein
MNPVAWLSDNPLVVSGAVMAAAAMAVLAMRVERAVAPGVTLETLPPAVLADVLAASPAYAVAVVVGVGAVVFWR